MDSYAVGFARPDRWSWGRQTEPARPWHAVEAHRLPMEPDGEIEPAVCGAIVQVRGSQKWTRVGAGRTACPDCQRITAVTEPLTSDADRPGDDLAVLRGPVGARSSSSSPPGDGRA